MYMAGMYYCFRRDGPGYFVCAHYTHDPDCRVIQRSFMKSFRIFGTFVSLVLDVYSSSKKDEISDQEVRLAFIS
jgi:hypothetical protein